MKKSLVSIVLSLGLLSSAAVAKHGYNNGGRTVNSSVSQTTVLTQDQIDGLVFMYQEEKVARDVYYVLGDVWDAQIFKNIYAAEVKHMAAVEKLLVKYGIEVPVLSDEVGVFELEALQHHYDDFIEKGDLSLVDALEVGVAIEEMDIEDLQDRMINVPDDILKVYANLLKGSQNHLRAFKRQLARQ